MKPLVVIADDDPDTRALVRAALQREDADVVEAADGRGLFWHLLRASFAHDGEAPRRVVVVTDVRMPSYDGLEVLDAWKDGALDVPAVVITSFPDDDVRARVAQLGATLVAKPFTRARLRSAVHAAVHRARS